MITLKQFAKYFETQLNNALKSDEAEFVIWPDAGKFRKAIRSGNTVKCKIHGLLTVSSSANNANNSIAIGVNGLILNLLIPLYTPRTNAQQTEEDLQHIQDNAYVFAENIRDVVDDYFKKAATTVLTDSKQVKYTVSWQAGTAATGAVELRPAIGNSIDYSVYVEATFAEGGINSQSVAILVDGAKVPFQSVRFGRTPVLERNVYAGEIKSTVFASSSAFSIDLDFPATEGVVSQAALSDVLDGELNTAHFVEVTGLQDAASKYFMAFANSQVTAMGANMVGVTTSLVEVAGNPSNYNVPATYGVYKFKFTNTMDEEGNPLFLNFLCSLTRAISMFVAGCGVIELTGAGGVAFAAVKLSENSFEWSEADRAYYVTLVTPRPLTIRNSNAEEIITVQG